MGILDMLELATLCDDTMDLSRMTTLFRVRENVSPMS